MSVVLVIEDEAPLLILAESVLKGEGYETLTAATVAEAQAIISSDQKLDVVVTDITLMEDAEAGLQIGQFLRQMRPGIPVLYTTGRGVTDGMIQMFIEPSGYLAKPYTDKQLTAAVAELLRGDPNKQRKAENE
jgi:DNA-binding NtrC family response regulator